MSSEKPETDNTEETVTENSQISTDSEEVKSQESATTEVGNTPKEEGDAPKLSGSAPRKKSGRGKWLFLLIMLLLLMAAGAGWYFSQQQFVGLQAETREAVSQQVAELSSEVSNLQQQLRQQSARQANIESAIIASSSETESQMLSLAERLSLVEKTGSGDWDLAEAEYLLRIANQRLVTSMDIDSAIEMMIAADNIFKALAYPELNEARRQLVADITNLGLVQPVDYEGIYFALDALLPRVSELEYSQIEDLTQSSETLEEPSGWSAYWASIFDALRPYIVINSSSNQRPNYLLSNEQVALLKSEIQLSLRQAQLALLAGEQAVYSSALESAASRLQESFAGSQDSDSLARTFIEFAERPIASDSVDISGSIREVERVIDQLTRIQLLDTVPAVQPLEQ